MFQGEGTATAKALRQEASVAGEERESRENRLKDTEEKEGGGGGPLQDLILLPSVMGGIRRVLNRGVA